MTDIEILNSSSNAVIAKLGSRQYPGILIQGDTLRNFLSEIYELQESVEEKNFESFKSIIDGLEERFTDLLVHYESVLTKNGFSLPYTNPVSKIND